MHRTKLFGPLAGAVLATAMSLVATTGMAGAAGSPATGTTHHVTQASQTNSSAATEKPVWFFTCDSSTHEWSFSINDVQVFDSTGHTWGGTEGPWSVGVFATTGAGPVPFNASAKLVQNKINGLFKGGVKGTASNAAKWCQTGASVTVTAFSGAEQSLLLDGTLG